MVGHAPPHPQLGRAGSQAVTVGPAASAAVLRKRDVRPSVTRLRIHRHRSSGPACAPQRWARMSPAHTADSALRRVAALRGARGVGEGAGRGKRDCRGR